MNAACPVTTGGGTRRVRLVRGGGEGGARAGPAARAAQRPRPRCAGGRGRVCLCRRGSGPQARPTQPPRAARARRARAALMRGAARRAPWKQRLAAAALVHRPAGIPLRVTRAARAARRGAARRGAARRGAARRGARQSRVSARRWRKDVLKGTGRGHEHWRKEGRGAGERKAPRCEYSCTVQWRER
jgi:hypothetical protein